MALDLWTVDKLAAHIRGELEVNPDAAGGTVPARLENIIIESGRGLWNGADWRFRWREGTLTTVAAASTAALPDDFAELCQRWIRRNNGDFGSGLTFVEDVTRWREYADHFDASDSSSNSEPHLATVIQDESNTDAFAWVAMLSPTPDAVYTYKFLYLRLDPWTHGLLSGSEFADTSVPLMPPTFYEGWHLYALARAQRVFGKGDDWKETWAAYKEWFNRSKSENDETLTFAADSIVDGYQDLAATSSADFYGDMF